MENVLKIVDTFIPALSYCRLTLIFGVKRFIHIFLYKDGYGMYNGRTNTEEFFETKELLVAKLTVFFEIADVEEIELNGKSSSESILIYKRGT